MIFQIIYLMHLNKGKKIEYWFLISFLTPNKKIPKFSLCKKKKSKDNNMKMKQNLNEIFSQINEFDTVTDSDKKQIKIYIII